MSLRNLAWKHPILRVLISKRRMGRSCVGLACRRSAVSGYRCSRNHGEQTKFATPRTARIPLPGCARLFVCRERISRRGPAGKPNVPQARRRFEEASEYHCVEPHSLELVAQSVSCFPPRVCHGIFSTSELLRTMSRLLMYILHVHVM